VVYNPQRRGELPEVRRDMIVMKPDEELVAGDGGEGQFNVAEEDDGGSTVGGALVLM
jgi:hypothetical protein